MEDYQVQGKPIFIEAHSRVSVKLNDTFYTFEFVERRDLPDDGQYNTELEKKALWKDVHQQVDQQVEDVVNMIKEGR